MYRYTLHNCNFLQGHDIARHVKNWECACSRTEGRLNKLITSLLELFSMKLSMRGEQHMTWNWQHCCCQCMWLSSLRNCHSGHSDTADSHGACPSQCTGSTRQMAACLNHNVHKRHSACNKTISSVNANSVALPTVLFNTEFCEIFQHCWVLINNTFSLYKQVLNKQI